MNVSIKENVSLAEFTTLKIGGAARFFVSATNEDEIIEAIEFARKKNLKVFILGGGSNVLIADEGFDGLVLQIALKGISVEVTENKHTVMAEAGEDWDQFVAYCTAKNLQGIECLSGIPGFVGGTPVQNVGAYGQEVSDTIVSVKCFDWKNRKIVELNNVECGFSYRTSIFNTTEKNRYVVLAVTYALEFGGEPKIVYRDLRDYFAANKPDLEETRHAVLKIRAEKSMVIDANDANSQSAGSFFKNPVVTKEKFAEIAKLGEKIGFTNMPSFEVDNDNVKIPAAWLIEKSGFEKGFEFGRVGISTKHTLAIINRGGAKAKDIVHLKDLIQINVKKCFDVELKPEPIFVGFADDKCVEI